jgi:hypothetical protein
MEVTTDSPKDFFTPWMNCPTSKQWYQHQLLINLTDEFKWFVDEKYPECG